MRRIFLLFLIGSLLLTSTSVAPRLVQRDAASPGSVALASEFTPSPSDQIIELDARDIAFEPSTITVEVTDLPVTIRMVNTGAAYHGFVIDALDISVETVPGETAEIVIPAGTAPGVYEFYCSIPGHRDGAGMFGALIIEGSSYSTERETQAPQ